jgi:hypothetical protein
MSFGSLIGSLINISEVVENNIAKILIGLSNDYKCKPEDIDVNIKYKNGKPVLYFYIDREFIKKLTSNDIEKYCI